MLFDNRKLVIGCAFMTPDVKYDEAYISFLVVHPEWRRSGVATFMIYHLLQVREERWNDQI
jgi:N-acetylglutamate synthase-like GNAT family acetyltransferase